MYYTLSLFILFAIWPILRCARSNSESCLLAFYSPRTKSFSACAVSATLRLSIPQVRPFSTAASFTLLILCVLVATFFPFSSFGQDHHVCPYFLYIFVEIDRFTTLRFAAGAGFFILMRPLRSVLIGIDMKYFTLFSGMSGAMQNACLFSTGR